jgi:tetratricopeptide (TPR) repeat protein
MTSDQATGAPVVAATDSGVKADVRPYIVKTYDRWIILAIVLIGGWFLFRPLFAFSVYYRGVSFEHMTALKIAGHYYQKAIGVDPRIPDGWHGLGGLYFMDARSSAQAYRDAVATFKKGLEYNPTSDVLAFDLCRVSLEVGKDYQQARSACELATKNWPTNAFAWDYAGWANARVGRTEQAIALWREAIKRGHPGAQQFINHYSHGG